MTVHDRGARGVRRLVRTSTRTPSRDARKTFKANAKKFFEEDNSRLLQAWEYCAKRSRKGKKAARPGGLPAGRRRLHGVARRRRARRRARRSARIAGQPAPKEKEKPPGAAARSVASTPSTVASAPPVRARGGGPGFSVIKLTAGGTGMRIAQVSPLFESVPPKLYGGTERVVSFLTEELVDLGHEVTLFASGDSATRASWSPARRARCASMAAAAIRWPATCDAGGGRRARRRIRRHPFPHRLPVISRCRAARRPALTTMHGRLDIAGSAAALSQRSPTCRWCRSPTPSGRRCRSRTGAGRSITGCRSTCTASTPTRAAIWRSWGASRREKRVDRAIEIARRLGMPLKIAAKIDDEDRDYYEREVQPLFDDPLVEFIGEIGEAEKGEFLGGAAALLFPIDWPEPFGLVMIEAMACGTPVVAFRCGSVPEVMRDGVSGYVVDTLDGAVEATAHALELPRKRCRAYFEGRFSAPRMARDYLAIYERLLAGEHRRAHRRLGLVPADAERRRGRALRRRGRDRLRRAVAEHGHPEMRRRGAQAPGQILHPGDLVARRRPDAGAQARRDVRGLRSLRRRAAGRSGRAGALSRRHALPVAPRGAHRRAAPAAAELDGQGRQRSARRRSHQPRPRGGRRATLARGELHLFRSKFLWRGVCYERLRLSNFSRETVRRSICGSTSTPTSPTSSRCAAPSARGAGTAPPRSSRAAPWCWPTRASTGWCGGRA